MNFIIDFIIGFTTLAVLMVWYIYLKQRHINRFYKNIPGPPGVPVLGNALDFKTKTKGILPIFDEYCNKYGGLVKVQIGPIRKMLLVSDYKMLEFILSSNKIINKSQNYRLMVPWLGTGLLTSGGIKWKKHRRIITPTFHFKILEQFVKSFEAAGCVLIKKLKKYIEQPSFDVYPLITLCTLDVICETAMGTTVNAQDNEESEYVKSVKEMGRIIMERALIPQKNNDFLFKFSKDHQIQKHALKVLHKYTNDIINNRCQELLNELSHYKDRTHSETGTRQKMAFLDLLLQATVDDRPLTNEEIREEVDTFMFEGHDTTASAVSFALYSLANNPSVQRKAYEEQVALFDGVQNPTVTYSNLQEMKYLEMVIKETLRLYPSVPFYARETTEDIAYGNTIIPKGVNINIFAYKIQRNPDYFSDPNNFNPSRFESVDGKLPYAFIPFSAGSRNCIGQKFAMMELKSLLSKILRNFELRPATPHQELQLVAETVLKSDNGVCIALKPRLIQ